MAAFVLGLLLLLYMISQPIAQDFLTNNDTWWKSLSSFQPQQGAHYGTITKRKSMYFELKLVYHGKMLMNEWENLLRIGKFGNDAGCTNHGNRYPALFILPVSNQLQISLSDVGECWFVICKQYNLQQNVIYRFQISYNQTFATVMASTLDIHTNRVIQAPHIIAQRERTYASVVDNEAMDVIISDPLSVPANATLFDIRIISFDYEWPSLPADFLPASPTTAPTSAPTTLSTSTAETTTTSTSDEDEDRAKDVTNVQMEVVMTVSYSNHTNASHSADVDDANEILRGVTEVVLNQYIANISNSSNQTRLVVVVYSDDETRNLTRREITLQSDYNTTNDSARLLAIYVDQNLYTDILERVHQNNANNTANITILNIDVKIVITHHGSNDDESEHISANENDLARSDLQTINVLVYAIIGVGVCCVCVFLCGVLVGHRMRMTKNVRRREREHHAIHSVHSHIGNIRNDRKLNQSSDSDDDDDDIDLAVIDAMETRQPPAPPGPPPMAHHRDDSMDSNDNGNIGKRDLRWYAQPASHELTADRIMRETILEVMGTPSGIEANDGDVDGTRHSDNDDDDEEAEDDDDDDDDDDDSDDEMYENESDEHVYLKPPTNEHQTTNTNTFSDGEIPFYRKQ